MDADSGSFGHSLSMVSAAQISRHVTDSVARVFPAFVATAVTTLLVVGWLQRDEDYLSPDSGTGYWLGIYGASAMLLLLAYSLRKRVRARRVGSIRFWFRTHMMLGITGPVLILYHANFQLGALNSNVALFTMLTVAMSGIVGKYIYGKIHMGLYGRRAKAKEILAEAEELKKTLGEESKAAVFVSEELKSFSDRLNRSIPTTALGSLMAGATLAVQARAMRRRLISDARRQIRLEGKAQGWSRRERRLRAERIAVVVRAYSAAVLKAAELAFYERVFALWHVLHLPLFFLMLMAATVHVWAVHHY